VATFQETFQSTVIPAFEGACQAMYKQMNDTFQRGTEDCKPEKNYIPSITYFVYCMLCRCETISKMCD
jgi:hypothetical protein